MAKVDRSLDFAQRVGHEFLPEYRTFFQIHQWGDPVVLESSLALAERSRGNLVDPTEMTEMLAKLEGVTPHMDNFGDFLSSYALNACVAVYYLLQFLIDHKPEYIYNVGMAYTDTVDFKLAEQDEDISDEELARHRVRFTYPIQMGIARGPDVTNQFPPATDHWRSTI
jgi:uncharacterized protein YjaG (DUF416 family)